MEPIIIVSPWFTKMMSIVIDVYAITIFPFIVSKEPMDAGTLNHETIHIKDKHRAYFMIPFEQEAYTNDQNLDYLKTRKAYSWRRFKV